jgi:hypothetical protein
MIIRNTFIAQPRAPTIMSTTEWARNNGILGWILFDTIGVPDCILGAIGCIFGWILGVSVGADFRPLQRRSKGRLILFVGSKKIQVHYRQLGKKPKR